jgi:hypothetical protein
MFAVLTIEKFTIAALFAVLVVLTLLAWHSKEPQEA